MIFYEGYEELVAQIKRHEGERKRNGLHVPYLDSEGVLTIGYGHNLEGKPIEFGDGITDDQAKELLYQDIMDAQAGVMIRYQWIAELCPARQGVIIDMAYNMGITSLSGFKRFLYAAERRDYCQAAVEMIDSKWARQVPYRTLMLVKIWLTGVWK